MGTELLSIPRIFHTYKVANVAAMNAITGMQTGEICTVDNTKETYRYSGSTWEIIFSSVTGIVWKDLHPYALDYSGSTDVVWSDCNISAQTSSLTRIAIIMVYLHLAAVGSGDIIIEFRKKGTTPSTMPVGVSFIAPTLGHYYYQTILIGVDTNQIFQYKWTLNGYLVDLEFLLLGYME